MVPIVIDYVVLYWVVRMDGWVYQDADGEDGAVGSWILIQGTFETYFLWVVERGS